MLCRELHWGSQHQTELNAHCQSKPQPSFLQAHFYASSSHGTMKENKEMVVGE